MAGQKQMLECTRCKLKSINSSFGDYEDRTMTSDNGQRVPWSREKYEYYNSQPKKSAVHDWSRTRLNFEINPSTGQIQEVDHNKPSLQDRWQAVMDKCYTATQTYKNPKNGKVTTKKRPVRSNEIKLVGTLMGGNRERMHKLAYDREVITGKAGIGRNGDVQRNPDVEEWAMDCYKWACKTWGRDNIVSFVVHLDETNPHIHCDYVPLVGGELSYTKMMHGRSGKAESSKHLKELHDSFAAEVGAKWGLERGKAISESGAGWKSMEEHQREVTEAEEQKNRLCDEINDLTVSVWESENRESELEESIRKKEQAERAINTKLANLEKKLAAAKITEEEYNRKVEYHSNKLIAVRTELDDLEKQKRKLSSEVSTLNEAKQESGRLEAQIQSQTRLLSGLQVRQSQEQARLTLLENRVAMEQHIGLFVRSAFYHLYGSEEQRFNEFVRNLHRLSHQDFTLIWFIEVCASIINYICDELELKYRDKTEYIELLTGISLASVKPKPITQYPEYRKMAAGVIAEWKEIEQQKQMDRKMDNLKEEASKWVDLCCENRYNLEIGKHKLLERFKAGDLALFIAQVQNQAKNRGLEKLVAEALNKNLTDNLMGEEYKRGIHL